MPGAWAGCPEYSPPGDGGGVWGTRGSDARGFGTFAGKLRLTGGWMPSRNPARRSRRAPRCRAGAAACDTSSRLFVPPAAMPTADAARPGSSAPRGEALPAQRLPVDSARALVWDIAELARQVPVFPVERWLQLSALEQVRRSVVPRISWAVMFLKAYALVAQRHPALRRGWVRWPWPHLVQWPCSVGMLAMHRQQEGQPLVCWARFCRPEERALAELQRHLQWYQSQPVESAFRRQLLFARLPRPLRRLIWWWNLHVTAAKRATRLGTFSISSLARHGAYNRGHPSLLTTSLTYGPLDERGRMAVTLLCDHRLLDGVLAAQALADLEEVLLGTILQELASLVAKAA